MIFLKDEVDCLELVLRKDTLKFLGIPESAQESYEACVQKVVDVLNDAGELAYPSRRPTFSKHTESTADVAEMSHAP